MEDRLSPRLYLELSDDDPAVRAIQLSREPAVERVTTWANLRPGRDELPMKVRDGTLLCIAEVSDAFQPPATAGTGVLFHRYPRPNQGCLTGRPTTGLLVVWISPQRPELAQSLRDWADFCHLRHIAEAAVPGYTAITPYEHVSGGEPRFMHLYEMDTDDPEGAYQLMPKLVAQRLEPDELARWADWKAPGGHIVYVNTFRRLS